VFKALTGATKSCAISSMVISVSKVQEDRHQP
jgi:hypothetical protein